MNIDTFLKARTELKKYIQRSVTPHLFHTTLIVPSFYATFTYFLGGL